MAVKLISFIDRGFRLPVMLNYCRQSELITVRNYFCEIDVRNKNRVLPVGWYSQICQKIVSSKRVSYFAAIEHKGEKRKKTHYHFLFRCEAEKVVYSTLKGSCFFGDADLHIESVRTTFGFCRDYMRGEGNYEGKAVDLNMWFEWGVMPVGSGRKAGQKLMEEVYGEVLEMIDKDLTAYEIVRRIPRVLPQIRNIITMCDLHHQATRRAKPPEKVRIIAEVKERPFLND